MQFVDEDDLCRLAVVMVKKRRGEEEKEENRRGRSRGNNKQHAERGIRILRPTRPRRAAGPTTNKTNNAATVDDFCGRVVQDKGSKDLEGRTEQISGADRIRGLS